MTITPHRPDPNDPNRKITRDFLKQVLIVDIMSPNVVSISMYDPFSEVEAKMRQYGIRHLPVLDWNGKLTGLITQRDLFRICPPRISEDGSRFYMKEDLDEYILRHVMIKNPYCLKPEDHLAEALFVMADKRLGCIPIIDDEKNLIGIVTRTDIIKAAARLLKE
jgi:acetoin utilization protein AcuB